MLLGGKVMTHLGSVLKSRDTALLMKFCTVRAVVFPGVTSVVKAPVFWSFEGNRQITGEVPDAGKD